MYSYHNDKDKNLFSCQLRQNIQYIIDYQSYFPILYSTKHQFFNKREIQKDTTNSKRRIFAKKR